MEHLEKSEEDQEKHVQEYEHNLAQYLVAGGDMQPFIGTAPQHLIADIDVELMHLRSRKEFIKQYDEAMKDGSIPLRRVNSVVIGVAGSGKTRSLKMILGEELPKVRVSTSCAKAPVRTAIRNVSHSKICVSDEAKVGGGVKITRTQGSEYFEMLMRTIKDIIARSRRGGDHHRTSTPASGPAAVEMGNAIPEFVQDVQQDMIQQACQEDPTTNKALLPDLHWNKMSDSGGQPQFLQIISAFIHDISLGIFPIKLNERLDHFPKIEYYNEDGVPVGQPYTSLYSHEQILRYCMRALVSQGRKDARTKLMFLGTHVDLKDQCIGESIADKNAKLREIVKSFRMDGNVVYSDNNFNLIFAINTMTPEKRDWQVMERVRTEIARCSDVPPVEIPIKWFALELILIRFVEEKKQAVLLESTCLEMVSSFHFDQDSLKAALQYLHQIKVIFYYQKKSLIVADIQVFLDVLSQVVRYNIELRTNPDRPAALDYKWKKFARHGILHASCLDKFPDNFIEGVFTREEVLLMFVDLCIVSKLGADEYLMPCILPDPKTAFHNPEPGTQTVPAMAIEFPNGGPMLGLYCGLLCYLMNSEEWTPLMDWKRDPLHLTRSSIHFKAPYGLPGMVTVSDSLSTFFLVTFHDGPVEVAEEVCPLVRESILAGIHQVSETLNYTPHGAGGDGPDGDGWKPAKPEVTFLCPCNATPLHTATMSTFRKFSEKFLSCPQNSCHYKRMTKEHRMWFGGTVVFCFFAA